MIESSVPRGSKTLLHVEVELLPTFEDVINVPSAGILLETMPVVSIVCHWINQSGFRFHVVEVNYSVSVSLQAEMHSRWKKSTGCLPR